MKNGKVASTEILLLLSDIDQRLEELEKNLDIAAEREKNGWKQEREQLILNAERAVRNAETVVMEIRSSAETAGKKLLLQPGVGF